LVLLFISDKGDRVLDPMDKISLSRDMDVLDPLANLVLVQHLLNLVLRGVPKNVAQEQAMRMLHATGNSLLLK
jgi:hypothetical protein